MKIPLYGQTGESFSLDTTGQRIINLYPSIEETGKSKIVLNPTPGARFVQSVTPSNGTGCRGGNEENSLLVIGDGVYEAAVKLGDLGTSSGRVVSASSGVMGTTGASPDRSNVNHCMFTDSSSVYLVASDDAGSPNLWELDGTTVTSGSATTTSAGFLVNSADTFVTDGVVEGMTVHNTTDDTYALITRVVSETSLRLSDDIFISGENYTIDKGYGIDWSSPTSCTFLDGYFIIDDQAGGTRGRFYISEPYDPNRWNALDYGEAQRHGDKIKRVVAHKKELWLIGKDSTEVWYNSGNPDFPFEPIQHGFIEYGTSWPHTVQQVENALLWLATTETGTRVVVKSNGLGVEVVSTPNVSNMIAKYETTDDVFSLSYGYGNHAFYVLTFPTDNISLQYDVYTGLWSEVSTGGNEWDVGFLYSSSAIAFNGAKLSANDRIAVEFTNGSNNTENIERKIISPVIHADDKALIYDSLYVDVDASALFIALSVTATQINNAGYQDFTDLSIVNDSSQIYNPQDNTYHTITAHTASLITTSTSHGLSIFDRFDIVDANGDRLYTFDVSMRYRDMNSPWSTAKTRTISSNKSRAIFRSLGKSRHRVFEIIINSTQRISVQAGYAELRKNAT